MMRCAPNWSSSPHFPAAVCAVVLALIAACFSTPLPEVAYDSCDQGARRCAGSDVEECDDEGLWSPVTTCDHGCQDAACVVIDEGCPSECEFGCLDGACCTTETCGEEEPASCHAESCGVATVSCCARIDQEGGAFAMGRSEAGNDSFPDAIITNDVPEHTADVSSFEIDRFEVTVGRFREFVDSYAEAPAAGSGANPEIPGSGWNSTWDSLLPATGTDLSAALDCDENATWTATAGDAEKLPISCATWYEAFAFCIWSGGRLPTEAEWEFVAAAGADNRRFPWGASENGLGSVGSALAADSPSEVGSFQNDIADSGVMDLAGNVKEWTADVHDFSWYSGDGAPCDDCANLEPDDGNRVLRGGSFAEVAPTQFRAARRNSLLPTGRFGNIGFRCVYTPETESP